MSISLPAFIAAYLLWTGSRSPWGGRVQRGLALVLLVLLPVNTIAGQRFFADWSASVQHQGWLMAQAVLDAIPEIGEIRFELPGLRFEHIRAGSREVLGFTAVTPKDAGSTRFCMGAAWRSPRDGGEFDQVLDMVRGVNSLGT